MFRRLSRTGDLTSDSRPHRRCTDRCLNPLLTRYLKMRRRISGAVRQTLDESRWVRLVLYVAACASFAIMRRTSRLSRAFSFANFLPRLSISRRSLRDSFSPSRFSPLIFLGSPSPS